MSHQLRARPVASHVQRRSPRATGESSGNQALQTAANPPARQQSGRGSGKTKRSTEPECGPAKMKRTEESPEASKSQILHNLLTNSEATQQVMDGELPSSSNAMKAAEGGTGDDGKVEDSPPAKDSEAPPRGYPIGRINPLQEPPVHDVNNNSNDRWNPGSVYVYPQELPPGVPRAEFGYLQFYYYTILDGQINLSAVKGSFRLLHRNGAPLMKLKFSVPHGVQIVAKWTAVPESGEFDAPSGAQFILERLREQFAREGNPLR